MAKQQQLQFSLITPESKVFEGPADFVAIPAHDGEIGILPERAPLVVQLGAGRLRLRTDQTEQSWFVDAGFAQVVDNRVVVLTQKAMRPADIDRDAAMADLERARMMPTIDDESVRRRTRVEASARARLRLSS
ncbi:MAG TPA: ATP synthase F1 subunit epsilon [Phycisphaerae bacterium]|nr:ATP synthase F1 subunit epsilon [Phycisphaerae bacterium]HOJ74802.1 ATP synthase F1 subunit epsilon [Phycisphaerae bacterium]HOM51965.1 ATP synthase F1 subunit epsilon [Phycisphaerae bacterium]HON66008.1 ATP synthase F1 subunit epsilon [Phycisphaerae bacterium]HOQ85654.1 ATP synthase F1 subunit epsilon [Phycisphaerae bacterium]